MKNFTTFLFTLFGGVAVVAAVEAHSFVFADAPAAAPSEPAGDAGPDVSLTGGAAPAAAPYGAIDEALELLRDSQATLVECVMPAYGLYPLRGVCDEPPSTCQ